MIELKRNIMVQGFRTDDRQCPGCMFPDAPEGKWPHTNDVRCKAWCSRCCCGHNAKQHEGGHGFCHTVQCDCMNFCDCHVIVSQMKAEDIPA